MVNNQLYLQGLTKSDATCQKETKSHIYPKKHDRSLLQLTPRGTRGNSCKITRSKRNCSPYWGDFTDARSLSREQIRHFDSTPQRWASGTRALAARLQRCDHYRSVLLSDWSASSWRKQHEFSDGPYGEDVGDGGALSQFNKHI